LRFWCQKPLKATRVTTAPHPGFMTDWQALWTTLMTQAQGKSEIVETIYEYRFAFVQDLLKMGAKIELFNPQAKDPEKFYSFNLDDDVESNFHAARVFGPTKLKGKELKVTDIRAGATLMLAALLAEGKSVLLDEGHIQRGYEDLDLRLKALGAEIKKVDNND